MKTWNEMTKGQKVWSIIAGVVAAPVVLPAAAGAGIAAVATGGAVVTGAVAADPIGAGLSVASIIDENR